MYKMVQMPLLDHSGCFGAGLTTASSFALVDRELRLGSLSLTQRHGCLRLEPRWKWGGLKIRHMYHPVIWHNLYNYGKLPCFRSIIYKSPLSIINIYIYICISLLFVKLLEGIKHILNNATTCHYSIYIYSTGTGRYRWFSLVTIKGKRYINVWTHMDAHTKNIPSTTINPCQEGGYMGLLIILR